MDEPASGAFSGGERVYEFNFCPVCGNELERGRRDGRERKYCTDCGFVRYRNPLPSAGAIVVHAGKILLIKRGRAPGKGSWAPPSGFIEVGETPEAACLRELEEETGVVGRIKELLGVYHESTTVYGDILVICYRVGFEPVAEGVRVHAGDDAEDARFFALDRLPPIRSHGFRSAIRTVSGRTVEHE